MLDMSWNSGDNVCGAVGWAVGLAFPDGWQLQCTILTTLQSYDPTTF
jgi:hypothetical protein